MDIFNFLLSCSLCSVRRCLFILLYVYFNLFTVNITQFNPRVAKLYSINYLSIYLSKTLQMDEITNYLQHFPWDLFIPISSEIVGDGFYEALKFGIFWEGMHPDPYSLGHPRRSIYSSCAYT